MLSARQQLLLFLLCWVTFAWFHQGGGWNQNARFAEVRAIVEQGRFAIDHFMVYRKGDGNILERDPVVNGEFTRDGRVHRLCWKTPTGLVPANGQPLDIFTVPLVIGVHTCSGDVGFASDGHFHPNKPPGASLLAVPVYFVALHIERALGFSPDDWRVIGFNAWLCSALTVSVASALCVVVFVRVAAGMFPGHLGAAIAAGLTFAFGTTFFPFGTLLFDHNTTTALLLGSFACVRTGRPLGAGFCAGAAAVVNYLAAIPGVFFGVWALARRWKPWDAARYVAGVVPCFIGLLAYNQAALGSPFALNTSIQNPAFVETKDAFLGMFTLPSWFAAECLTISPWRGVFVLSPVLLLSIVGLVQWRRLGSIRAEWRITIAVIVFFFVVNVCFNGFHGGFSAGPRYLIPALPFFCLPLVPVFARWRWLAAILAVVSIGQQGLLTATDAQNPLGMGDHAWRNKPDEWKEKLRGNSLVWLYAWPLFAEGRAWPPLREEWKEWLEQYPYLSAEERAEAWAAVERGEREPLLLAAIPGPVSVNPVGPWDGSFFALFEPHTIQSNFASWNAGEFLLPSSRWSLAPLILLWGLWAFGTLRRLPGEGAVTSDGAPPARA